MLSDSSRITSLWAPELQNQADVSDHPRALTSDQPNLSICLLVNRQTYGTEGIEQVNLAQASGERNTDVRMYS